MTDPETNRRKTTEGKKRKAGDRSDVDKKPEHGRKGQWQRRHKALTQSKQKTQHAERQHPSTYRRAPDEKIRTNEQRQANAVQNIGPQNRRQRKTKVEDRVDQADQIAIADDFQSPHCHAVPKLRRIFAGSLGAFCLQAQRQPREQQKQRRRDVRKDARKAIAQAQLVSGVHPAVERMGFDHHDHRKTARPIAPQVAVWHRWCA